MKVPEKVKYVGGEAPPRAVAARRRRASLRGNFH